MRAIGYGDKNYVARAKIIATLFGAYGQSNDSNRQLIYSSLLKDLPVELLEKACGKLVLEKKFMPTVSEIVEAARSLVAESHEEKRVKTWAEAWSEIESSMFSTQYGKQPKFSTPEISAAVKSYGWSTLINSLEADMPTVRAQVRRIYDEICQRTTEKTNNCYILGGNQEYLVEQRIADSPVSLPEPARARQRGFEKDMR